MNPDPTLPGNPFFGTAYRYDEAGRIIQIEVGVPAELAGTVDPRLAPGVDAEIGSRFYRRTGVVGGVHAVYYKYGPLDTDWYRITRPSICDATTAAAVQDIIRVAIDDPTAACLPSNLWSIQNASRSLVDLSPAPIPDLVGGAAQTMTAAAPATGKRVPPVLGDELGCVSLQSGQGGSWTTAGAACDETDQPFAYLFIARSRITLGPPDIIIGGYSGAAWGDNGWWLSHRDGGLLSPGYAIGLDTTGQFFFRVRDTLGTDATVTNLDAGNKTKDGSWHPMIVGRTGENILIFDDVDGFAVTVPGLGSLTNPASLFGLFDARNGLGGGNVDIGGCLMRFRGAAADVILGPSINPVGPGDNNSTRLLQLVTGIVGI